MKNSKRKQHCNKIRHATQEAAQIAAAMTVKRKAKSSDPIVTLMSAYKCQYCPGWHVGKKSRGINWDFIAKHDEKLRQLRSQGS